MIFPKTLVILFLLMTAATSVGAIGHVVTTTDENMTLGDKVWEVARIGINMPNATDDFTAQAIRYTADGPPEGARDFGFEGIMLKYYYIILIIAVVGYLFLFNLFFKLSRWGLEIGRPPGSAERGKIYSVILAVAILGILTGFDAIRAVIEVLS